MPETTAPTSKLLTGIYCEGSLYSVHLDPQEADSYLSDLQLVHTGQKFDVQDIQTGRVSGEEKAAWSSTGAIDLINGTIYGFRRVWAFPNQYTPIPELKVGQSTGRYIWLTLATTEENQFIRAVKPLLQYRQDPKTNKVIYA